MVNANGGLLSPKETASHEWLYGYLFFKPLGRGYFAGGRAVEINEVLAQVFGTEIGRITYNRITGQNIPTLAPPQEALPEDSLPRDDPFAEFFGFMRETRVRMDALLEEGRIEESEAYMEASVCCLTRNRRYASASLIRRTSPLLATTLQPEAR